MTSRTSKYRVSQREARAFTRKRAVAACRVCRSRKIKCDNARPTCSSCQLSEAHCVYQDHIDFSRFDPATIAILDRLAEIQQSLNSLNSGEVTALSLDGPQKEYMTDVDPQTPQTVSLRIPAAKICPDAILSWPILRDVRLQTSLNSLTLADHDHGVEEVASSDLNLALIPGLIDRFLQFVHVKNPVVDTVALRQSAVTVEVGESSRNSHSCLVFLACALGCLAGPLRYDDLSVERDDHAESRHTTGEQFYRKALESISLPGDRILTAQCWFLSGVYQMYKLNAARAWMDFSRASAALSLHLRHREAAVCKDSNGGHLEPAELSLYWTCWKSECDLRAELNVPDSVLCEFSVSDGYPVPSSVSMSNSGAMLSETPTDSEDLTHLWELSTYYYLSDVALMRVEARILNSMYSTNDAHWSPANPSYLCRTAADLESQIDHWSRNLPSIIRFEEWDSAPQFELTYNLQARVLQLRSWLYRPFVYYAIHHNSGQSNEDEEAKRFMRKAIECSFHLISSKATQHRHHGTWFVARGVLSSALLIIAAIKADKGLVDYLADWPDLLDQAIRSLSHWASEARDLAYAVVVLANLKQKLCL
ncbi:transcriptional regulator family: Fungal Specific TF [Aspergillus niger]|nr:transcriptional regulator family: Fungal Specific TF [Aspergillus niger]KAI2892343.1 transcriptional regulator family: Fungal Specific TF [Aspergillus niger]KAI2962965.1 transcriptional regulator family: Fungal Specific TF [Aspergillus niger]KAI2979890.1 transcriptional regulator family: Fungal Specific TF [Aspergillus niger]KAI2986711.1 transcriptional regulator family: Fungal Specific TF [Aspergillus niger]